ncbi:TolC family outer membrane protein [Ramlibacter sp. 2FC]|uniref:TolC family outer membrane protein n=1 Tax=Ramlibacter sp. 2FC TaxID=2502188 RepID=UPI0010F9B17F|nr:TolC family outer membrane protein [Ramlibacter sp. 2FC]
MAAANRWTCMRGLALRRSALALALALFAAPAWSLDLMQAYEAALAQDANIRASRAAAKAGREQLPQAQAQLRPNISANLTRSKNWLDRTEPQLSIFGQPTGREVSSSLDYLSSNYALTLRQPLYRPQQHALIDQAQAKVDDAEAVLERDLQQLGVKVGTAYFEALLADDQLALVLSQKASYTTQLDAAQKALAGGSGTRTDIDEAQARLDMALAQELEARQHQDYTRRQLQLLVNQPLDRLAPLDVVRLQLQPPDPNRIEDWTARAEQGSPEIHALKARIEAARHEVAAAQAGHYPTLDAVLQWSKSDRDNLTSPSSRYTNKALGLVLRVPIYAGGYVDSTVRQALAEQEQAEEALEALRRELGLRVHKEFRGVTEGVLRIRALEQAVRSAEQLVLSNRRSLQAGSRTLVDVLNAEQHRVETQRDLAQARYLYLVSRIRLQALAGGEKTGTIEEINAWLGP